jgi:hypothetical protein
MQSRDQNGETDDRPIDLSALDPDRDGEAESRLIHGIMAGRRQTYPIRRDLLISVWAMDRRMMAGVAAIAALMLVVVGVSTRTGARAPLTVAESIGVPQEFLGRSADDRQQETR